MKLENGQTAPTFPLLNEHAGKWRVLYFYPKANSYGCSIEAQRFEAALPEFERYGAQVIGISTDTKDKQANFQQTCSLTFPLVADPDKQICKAYGVIGGLMGLMGTSGRASFVIDPLGKVAYQLHNISHTVHVKGALEALEKLTQA